MKSFEPHKKSQQLRQFKPSSKPAGIFTLSLAFCDATLLVLAFFLAVSPFVLQPGVNITLPASPFSGGACFGSMILSIPRGGWFYFNDERLDSSNLSNALEAAAIIHPDAVLIIEVDELVPHGIVIEAWNAALAAGISEVSMATRISAISEDVK